MRRYTRIGKLRIFGAALYLHWSTLVVGALVLLLSLRSPAFAAVAVASYFTMLLVHEAGHAWFARHQRLRPIAIRLYAVHGTCEYESPEYEEQECIVAWGGVLAQLAVAVPLIALDAAFGIGRMDPWGALVAVLGYGSIVVAAYNLVPARGMDGAKTWRLLALWYEAWRERRAGNRQRKRAKRR